MEGVDGELWQVAWDPVQSELVLAAADRGRWQAVERLVIVDRLELLKQQAAPLLRRLNTKKQQELRLSLEEAYHMLISTALLQVLDSQHQVCALSPPHSRPLTAGAGYERGAVLEHILGEQLRISPLVRCVPPFPAAGLLSTGVLCERW